jgi:hypothetical protein
MALRLLLLVVMVALTEANDDVHRPTKLLKVFEFDCAVDVLSSVRWSLVRFQLQMYHNMALVWIQPDRPYMTTWNHHGISCRASHRLWPMHPIVTMMLPICQSCIRALDSHQGYVGL